MSHKITFLVQALPRFQHTIMVNPFDSFDEDSFASSDPHTKTNTVEQQKMTTTTPLFDSFNSEDVLAADDFHDLNEPEKILWSCVSRNGIILAEAGEDCYGGLVVDTAQALLRRKATPGYEFHSIGRRKWLPTNNNPKKQEKKNSKQQQQHVPTLRGCKFHIFEHDEDEVEKVRIWVFAAVYDSSLVEQLQVQSFLEKIVALTEMFRNNNNDNNNDDASSENWKTGGTLSCQPTFAPILLQRMREVTYLGKMAMLQEHLDNSKQIMGDNIDVLLEREDKLRNQLNEKSSALHEMASVFRRKSRNLRRRQMMQNAKHGLVLGTAVTAGVAIVVVPPLVAIL